MFSIFKNISKNHHLPILIFNSTNLFFFVNLANLPNKNLPRTRRNAAAFKTFKTPARLVTPSFLAHLRWKTSQERLVGIEMIQVRFIYSQFLGGLDVLIDVLVRPIEKNGRPACGKVFGRLGMCWEKCHFPAVFSALLIESAVASHRLHSASPLRRVAHVYLDKRNMRNRRENFGLDKQVASVKTC